ncbi:hypothetical protein ACERK3_13945 [Phycisphaerales bacterium AB-hyl4]|uniref:Uncharacterized protein n=1 Tax=Natronomicrosphaera hydrolytica TaxID=3242702 RepID=A0ABV4U8T2_9BACT
MSNVTVLHDEAIVELARSLVERGRAAAARRVIVGIAGVPGSGKSTLAARLRAAVEAEAAGLAVVVAMDGFHMTNAALRSAGLASRKGSPETFEAARYVALLRRCRDCEHVERVPIYDRAVHEPRLSDEPGCAVTRATRVIITEGNYVLLDREPWSELADVLDEGWLLDVPAAWARAWLLERHMRTGRSRAEAERKCEGDALNAGLVRSGSRAADRVLCWPT